MDEAQKAAKFFETVLFEACHMEGDMPGEDRLAAAWKAVELSMGLTPDETNAYHRIANPMGNP